MAVRAQPGEDRILTVPNVLTLIRLACIPLFVWLLARPDRAGWYPAALLLGLLGITDGLDGYIARHFNQVSTVGKVLDPVADRLLLGVAGISVIVVGAVPLGVGVLALGREAVVAAGFLYVAAAGGRRMDVQWSGKASTFALMCALPLFLVGHADDDWHRVAEAAAWVCVVPGLVLGWYSAVTYVPKARAALAESRRRRSEEADT
ncbi:MAG TPA: CDP-alcohol phosphatidyltransferase family protein [Acidimicrobiales bacterium]|nr:CDP-alcohol phosphatidyltransferase family protein [Acidimicrobiales bacterium]